MIPFLMRDMRDQRMPEKEVRELQRLAASREHDSGFRGWSCMREPKDKREKPVPKENPAGPHARPELTEKEKTPGSGMLPEPDDSNSGPTG
jgi:hypothetical protein